MAPAAKCSHCGNPVDRPEDLCPRCVLASVLSSETTSQDQPDHAPNSSSSMNASSERAAGSAEEYAGSVIGRYTLLEELGEGGFGTVWLAWQASPLQRRVALKIIKLGMDTRDVIARFELERQALALMDHPNIAKVLDGGATASGRPYFVMELVPGLPITEYCDTRGLSPERRLVLFLKICRAVQHADQKGIIHRDIKPTNVLVIHSDGEPLPKVIDFGIAKSTQAVLGDNSVFTHLHQVMGTPAYMSPEQASFHGTGIDTRSDIYSLGVLLYELLTGLTPFSSSSLLGAGIDHMRRTILDQDPTRPSTRLRNLDQHTLAEVARRRSIHHSRLPNFLSGDLDWIVMRCLEKSRDRRYETANGLAMDLERFLNNEPIAARPPSMAYRLRKTCSRHRIAVSVSTGLILALLVGLAVVSLALHRERIALANMERSAREQNRLHNIAVAARNNEARQLQLAEDRLYKALVSEAIAVRASGTVGYRERVIALIQQANALARPGKNNTELRDAVVSSLGDFVGLEPRTLPGPGAKDTLHRSFLDPTGRAVASIVSDGSLAMVSAGNGSETARLRLDLPATAASFDSTGMKLISVHDVRGAVGSSGAQVALWKNEAEAGWQLIGQSSLPGAFQCHRSTTGLFVTTFSQPTQGRLVDALTQEEVLQFQASAQGLPVSALTADGKLLLVEAFDPSDANNPAIEVWDVATGTRSHHLRPKSGGFWSIIVAADNNTVCTTSVSGVTVSSILSGEPFTRYKGYFMPPTAAFFLPGRSVMGLPLIQQNTLKLWDWVRQTDVATIEEPSEVLEAAVAEDGESLFTFGRTDARRYDLNITDEVIRWHAHEGGIPDVAFSPDGNKLATIGKDNRIRLWNLAGCRKDWESEELPGPDQGLAFTPDGRILATASYQSTTVRLWESQSGRPIVELAKGPIGSAWQECIAFSGDGRLLATTGSFGVRMWALNYHADAEGLIQLEAKPFGEGRLPALGWCRGLAFSHDSRYLAFSQIAGKTWNCHLFEPGGEGRSRIVSTNATASGHSLYFIPGEVALLMLRSDQKIVRIEINEDGVLTESVVIDVNVSEKRFDLASFTISPDGSMLAINEGSHRFIDIWDYKRRVRKYSLPKDAGTAWSEIWQADSRGIAISRSNGDIALWRLGRIDQILVDLQLLP